MQLWVCIMVFGLLCMNAAARYEVFSWNNFDGGDFPGELQRTHQANEQNTRVIDYSSGDAPQGISAGVAQSECGKYGLKLETGVDQRFLKVTNSSTLDRSLLGSRGKALYQADFYLSENSPTTPYSQAVLAVHQSENEEGSSFSFYRFGILKGERIFFSYTNNSPQPLIYEQARIDQLNLKKPGWHRFQIIFDGQEKIICAVDGNPVEFSPVMEGSLDTLKAGIMVTAEDNETDICYADNLSIQWTQSDDPVPVSPWDDSQQEGGAFASSQAVNLQQTQLNWTNNPEAAWNEARSSGKPLLVIFYSRRARPWNRLSEYIASNSSAKNFLREFVLLRLDINQLRGGSVAKIFNVFRVPCMIQIGADGNEKARLIYTDKTQWSEVTQTFSP